MQETTRREAVPLGCNSPPPEAGSMPRTAVSPSFDSGQGALRAMAVRLARRAKAAWVNSWVGLRTSTPASCSTRSLMLTKWPSSRRARTASVMSQRDSHPPERPEASSRAPRRRMVVATCSRRPAIFSQGKSADHSSSAPAVLGPRSGALCSQKPRWCPSC